MLRLALLTALALAAAPAAAQKVHRCVAADGAVSFQGEPCAPGSRGGEIAVRAPNLVDGNPTGVAQTRAETDRYWRAYQAIQRGEVIEGMTAGEVRSVLGRPDTVLTETVGGESRQVLVFRSPLGTIRRVEVGPSGVTTVKTITHR